MPRSASIARALTLAVMASLVPALAAASPDYPAAMKADLGLSAAPGCDLCHHAAKAPVGAVDSPFGQSMVAHGLVKDDDASLKKALDAMRAAGVDSDGDGAKDLDELSWGGNPSVASLPEGGNTEPATYGCAAPRGPVDPRSTGVLLAALAAFAARRRRPARA